MSRHNSKIISMFLSNKILLSQKFLEMRKRFAFTTPKPKKKMLRSLDQNHTSSNHNLITIFNIVLQHSRCI